MKINMFEYRKTDYFLVDYNNGESTKIDCLKYTNVYTWHKQNQIDFSEKIYNSERFDYKDNTINNYLRMEIVTEKYKKCLTFLKSIK